MPQILTYSQFCKTSINLQLVKQGIYSQIPEAAVQMNLRDILEQLFCTTYNNHIQNRCSKKFQISLDNTCAGSLFNKAAGLRSTIFF